MKIAIGSDHAGYVLKQKLGAILEKMGHCVEDVGSFSAEIKADYPDWGFKVAEKVASGKAERGVLVCGSGIGMSITANKVPGVYAALCHDGYSARMSRQHNDANVLVLGSRVTGEDLAEEILDIWLKTSFEGGRHLVRRQKIEAYELESCNQGHMPSQDGSGRVVAVSHPLILHKLAIVRDKYTSVKDFRDLVQEIAGLMVYEIFRNLPLSEIEVETPVCPTKAFSLAGKKLAVIPVLRAGLGMVEGILRLIPNAKVGHIGLYRDPETLMPVDYYCKLPKDIEERDIFILDPMLATGGSAAAAISHVKKQGGRKISLVSLIAAPEGVARVHEEHPEVDIFTAAIDSHLNEHGYIVPGLGDAGDRLFGTK